MYHVPPKIVLDPTGDAFQAAHFRGQGREFLRQLEHGMTFQDLKQAQAFHDIHDVTGQLAARVHVESRFGEGFITIFCPTTYGELKEEREEVVVESRRARFFIKVSKGAQEDGGAKVEDLTLVRHLYLDLWNVSGLTMTSTAGNERGIMRGDRLGDAVVTSVSGGSITFDRDIYAETIGQVIVSIYRLVERTFGEYTGEIEYDYYWVEFEADKGATSVDVFPAPNLPTDFRRVGSEKESIHPLIPKLYYDNYGGKTFEINGIDNEGNEKQHRFVGYTGCAGLLYRNDELVHEVGPDLENNTGIDPWVPPVFYWPNYHKFNLLNKDGDGQYLAWYFYRQFPYWLSIPSSGEYDWRFSKAEVHVCKITGRNAETIMESPRMSCHGGWRHSLDRSVLTSVKEDSSGVAWTNSKMGVRGFAALDSKHQMQQGAHAGLDIVSCSETGEHLQITMYQNDGHALAKITYRFLTEEEFEQKTGLLWHRWRGEIVKKETGVSSTEMLVWSSEGSTAVPALEMEYEINSSQEYPSSEYGWRKDGPAIVSYSIYTGCHREYTEAEYFFTQNSARGVSAWAVTAPSFYWFRSMNPTGGRVSTYHKMISFRDLSKRIMKMGEMGNCVYSGSRQRNAVATDYDVCPQYPNANLACVGMVAPSRGLDGSEVAGVSVLWRYWSTGYLYANASESSDSNDFSFIWWQMFNEMNAPGVEIFSPNVFRFKGKKKRSVDRSSGTHFVARTFTDPEDDEISRLWLTMRPWERCTRAWGYPDMLSAVPPASGLPSMKDAAEIMLADEEFSCELEADDSGWNVTRGNPADPTKWGIAHSKRSNRSAECEETGDEIRIFNGQDFVEISDDSQKGVSSFFFMDDRSTENSQGVFTLSRSGTERKFCHFWDNEQPVDVTEDILEGLGFTTPQQRASIQCIGVI